MPQKLKIAVQLYGHLRTFEKCARSLQKNLLELYDADVFIHTWSETEAATQTWHNEKCRIKSVDSTIKEKIEKLYHPVRMEIETQNLPAEDSSVPCLHNNGAHPISAAGLNFMLYTQKQVNTLRRDYQQEHNIQYDYVIMIRPDIRLETPFRLDRWSEEIAASVDFPARFCAINGFAQSKTLAFTSDIASDILFFAKPNDMDLIISKLDTLNFDAETKMWNPESLINAFLFKNGIASLNLHYYLDRDWLMIRCAKNKGKLRKRIIKFKLSSSLLRLILLPTLDQNIFSAQFSIFNVFTIDFSIGKKKCLM